MNNNRNRAFKMKRFMIRLFAVLATLGVSGTASSVELLNLITREAGMYRITYESLAQQGADLNGLRHRAFALTLNGEPIQIRSIGRTDGNRREFGAGGYIEFYAESADSLYSVNQTYTLHLINKRQRHLRKRILNVRNRIDLTAPFAEQYTHRQTVEQNNTYDFAAPSTTDPFHFGQTFSFFATPTYEFELDNVAGGSDAAEVEVEMYGLLDFDIEGNDHHYEVEINGQVQGDQQFDGATATQLTLSDVAVTTGKNTFKYNYRSIAGVPFDRITLNKFTVSYARTTLANNQYLEGRFDVAQARVKDVANSMVYRRGSDGVLLRVLGSKADGDDRLFSTGGVVADYIVVGEAGYKVPQISLIADAEDITSGTAEYLVIAHPSLMGAELDELVRIRSDQYLVKVVDVNQIYAQFGHHAVGAAAIKSYIDYASNNMGMQMAVLIGNDTLDYKNHTSSSVSLVPTRYVTTPGGALIITQTPSDASYGDIDNDGIPDRAVARISARTKAELGYVVDKIKAYEIRDGYQARTIVATDKDDLGNGVSFRDDAEDIIAAIPSAWSRGLADEYKVYPDVEGHQQAHDKLIALINAGAAVVSYVGHSSQQSWAYTTPPMFRAVEVPGLSNIDKPAVVTQWGCWNTYFVDPRGNTMSDMFLLSEGVGAATVLGASTLTGSSGERALGIELNKRMYTPGMSLGEAVILAKQALAQKEDYPDVQLGWQILGDPGIVINNQP